MKAPDVPRFARVYGVALDSLLALLCSVLAPLPAAAQADDWELSLTPYFWAAEIRGHAVVRGVSAPADVDFSDVLKSLDLGFMAQVEGRKGDLVLIANGLFIDLGEEVSAGPIEIDVDFQQVLAEFHVGHRLASWGRDQPVSVEGLVGARYTYFRAELDPALLPSVDKSRDWVDPLVGLRALWSPAPDWRIALRGEVGGFGLGSDRTWGVGSYVTSRLSERTTLVIGYRIVSFDYDDGSGAERFEFDVKFRGPILAATFQF